MGGKLENRELRLIVWDYCDRLGFWNVPVLVTAKEIGTAHQNVSRWKKAYVKKYGDPDVKKLAKEINLNSQVALKEMMGLIGDENPRVRIAATQTYFDAVDKFTKFLENFNFKEKVPDAPREVIVKGYVGFSPDEWDDMKKVIDVEAQKLDNK